jgi:hypothetical protein
MKNTKTLLILIVLFITGVISGLSLTGCSRSNRSSTGRFTLTGIPSQYNGKYAYFMGSNIDYEVDAYYVPEAVAVFGANFMPTIFRSKGELKFPEIKRGSVTLPLRYAYISSGLSNLDSYRRSEALKFIVYIYDHEKIEASIMDNWICNVTFNSVIFSDGNATRAWSAADDVTERRQVR